MIMAWRVAVGESDFEGVPLESIYYFVDKSDARTFFEYMDENCPSDLIQYVREPKYLEVKPPKIWAKGEWHP
jgi:hypothetical protein